MKSLRRVLLIVSLVAVTTVVGGGVAQAHVLRVDNGISGVLHIPPSDTPRANEVTKFYVAFGDKHDKFSLTDCNCNITIKQNGKTVSVLPTKPQLAGATIDSISSFTFPSIGVYNLTVNGSAKKGQFPNFTLPYVIRVASDATAVPVATKQSNTSLLVIIGAGIVGFTGIFGYARIRDRAAIKQNR